MLLLGPLLANIIRLIVCKLAWCQLGWGGGCGWVPGGPGDDGKGGNAKVYLWGKCKLSLPAECVC